MGTEEQDMMVRIIRATNVREWWDSFDREQDRFDHDMIDDHDIEALNRAIQESW